ncbi:MAG: RHS repeat protein, partial [Gammaproteobacteria bacterium]|nr:RHS repeat protein [Gammaproteobacteria bacterium]
RHEYDANGNRLKTIDPRDGESVYTYDKLNRLISVTDRPYRSIPCSP